MIRKRLNNAFWRTMITLTGSVMFLQGCDPTLRATVEDGLITTSTSLFGAFMRAFINVASESAVANAEA